MHTVIWHWQNTQRFTGKRVDFKTFQRCLDCRCEWKGDTTIVVVSWERDSKLLGNKGVSKNRGTPKSSILIGFYHYKPSILGYPYFGNTHMFLSKPSCSRFRIGTFLKMLKIQISKERAEVHPRSKTQARWWFQIFCIFTPTWGRCPFWLIFFRWVETTNQQATWLVAWFGGLEFTSFFSRRQDVPGIQWDFFSWIWS